MTREIWPGGLDMLVQTGKHAGKAAEEILLKSPDWAEWLMTKHPKNDLVPEFKRLIPVYHPGEDLTTRGPSTYLSAIRPCMVDIDPIVP